MPKLIIKRGESAIKKLSVPESVEAFTVGCERGNDIIIKDDSISFFHLQFEKQNGSYFVRDLQSQWGTFVNGEKISNLTEVRDRDEVCLGEHAIVFLASSPQPASAEQTPPYQGAAPVTCELKIAEKVAGVPALREINNWLLADEQEELAEEASISNSNGQNRETASKEPALSTVASNSNHAALSANSNHSRHTGGSHEADTMVTLSTPLPVETAVATPPSATREQVSNPRATTPTPVAGFDHLKPPSPHKNAAPIYLLGIHGYYLGRKFKINPPEARIGRDSKMNDIVIRKNSRGKIDPSISRRHATLKYRNGKWYLSDKRSLTRTRVNQTKLGTHDHIALKPGDEIEIVGETKNHIFRVVKGSEWDYSFPRKAGAWHVRNFANLLNAGVAAIILLAVFFFVKSFNTSRLISSRPGRLTLKEEVWGASDIDSKLKPGESTHVAAADVNDDGFIDLLYINNRGHLSCVNGKSKEPLWTAAGFKIDRGFPVLIEDLLGNGSVDVIVAATDSRLRAMDGKWGIEVWKSPLLPAPLDGRLVVDDLNGDGLKDVAVLSGENSVYVGYSQTNKIRWVSVKVDGISRSGLSAGDVTGDGRDNILLGTDDGRVAIIDGSVPSVLSMIDINEELSKASGRFGQNNQIRTPISPADLNSDGIDDIVAETNRGNLIALAGGSFERLWYDTPDARKSVGRNLAQTMALGDLDGDRQTDIVLQNSEGRLTAMKGLGPAKDRKTILWQSPGGGAGSWATAPVLADFNRNGTLDVVSISGKSGLTIIEGATGELLAKRRLGGAFAQSNPVIADFDKDHYLDILFLKDDGRFHKVSTNRLSLSSAVLWNQAFANGRRTRFVESENLSAMGSLLTMLAALAAIAGAGAARFFVIRQRRKLSYY